MTKNPYRVSRFRRAIVHFLGGRALQASARAVLILILIRVLDVSDYGVYMLLIGLSEMLLEVVSFGLLPVAQRFVPQMLVELPLKKMMQFVVTLVLLQLVVLCIVALVIWQYWADITPLLGLNSYHIEVARVGILLFIVIPTFRFSVELLEGHLEQGKAQLSRALMPMARALAISCMLVLGQQIDLNLVLWVDISVTTGCLALSWFLLFRSMNSLHNPTAKGAVPMSEIFQFAWHMAPVGILGSTASPGALRMVLASVLGIVESGLFAFLQSVQRLIGRYLPGTLLRGIIRPVLLARAYSPGGMTVVEAGTSLLVKSNLVIVAAAAVVIALIGDDLVAWLSGGKFTQSGSTLLLMFVALAITSQRAIIEMVMQITGHTATLRATAIIAPIALFFVWRFAGRGLDTAIVIMAIGSFASNSIAMRCLIKSTRRFIPDWKGISYIFIATALAISFGFLMQEQLHRISNAVVCGSLYVVTLLILRPFNESELQLVERALGGGAARLMKICCR